MKVFHIFWFDVFIYSDIMFFESLITYEEWLIHFFLTFITCHVNSLTSWLLIIIETFIELKKFSKKFNEWLSFNVSKYLINLFQKISSDCFIYSFYLKHEHFQNLWLSLQFTHCLLFINTMHFLMWCLFVHLKQHSSFLQNLVI